MRFRNGICASCNDAPIFASGFCWLCTPRRVISHNPEKHVVFVLVNPRGMEREVLRSVGSTVTGSLAGGSHATCVITPQIAEQGYVVVDVSELAWTLAELSK